MLSDKYVAGFLDADGSIQVKLKGEAQKPLLSVSFSQREDQDGVIHQIQEQFGGRIRTKAVKGGRYTELVVNGKAARRLLDRVAKHLVVKRYYAQWCRDACEQPTGDRKAFRKRRDEARRQSSLPLPNFPPRKWLAGYLDGDGCFYAKRQGNGSRKAVQLALSVASSPYDNEGLRIIQQAFGGRIKVHEHSNWKNELILELPPSKAEKVLGYCSDSMVVKRDQAKFILGCARMGHYRDGDAIHAGLKHLKTRPHRLSDPDADLSELLERVQDDKWGGHRRKYDACLDCGTTERPHYARGYCSTCYHARQRAGEFSA